MNAQIEAYLKEDERVELRQALELHEAGLTPAEIAAQVDYAPITVWKWLKKMGLTPNPRRGLLGSQLVREMSYRIIAEPREGYTLNDEIRPSTATIQFLLIRERREADRMERRLCSIAADVRKAFPESEHGSVA
jgi:hypothetical protein